MEITKKGKKRKAPESETKVEPIESKPTPPKAVPGSDDEGKKQSISWLQFLKSHKAAEEKNKAVSIPLPVRYPGSAYDCDICQNVFTTKWSLQDHRNSVHEGIRYLCDHCDHIASSKRNLRGHMDKKHPDKPMPTQFTSIKAGDIDFQKIIQNHRQNHLARMAIQHLRDVNVEEEYNDDGVPYKFAPIDQELEEKLESITERLNGVWTCRICQKTAGTKFHLKRHAETHLGFKHTCPSCFKKYSTRPSLKHHYDSHHKEDKPTLDRYPCDLCQKSSISKGALRVHKFRHHTMV